MAACNVGGEDARLSALHRFQVLDTEPEEAFDRITRLAKTVLAMPMVVVSLVDQDRQWFKSRQGVEATETARNISFCTHTIQDTQTLIVTDALADPRFAQSPLVLGEPHIRFYIGVPLRTRDGHNVGALCSMDTEVRQLSDPQIKILEDLARLVVDELELRLLASTDSLTGAMSRRSFREQTNREIARAKRHSAHLSCALIDVDHFKSINDRYGHGVGDVVLQRVVSICKSELRASDYIGRIGGEEFAVIFPETALMPAFDVAERLRKAIEAAIIEVSGQKIRVTASIGVAEGSGAGRTTDLLLQHADVAMYEAKLAGRNRVIRYAKDEIKSAPVGVESGQSLTGIAQPPLRPTSREETLVRLVR
jgi:diguanylate cyclase (GGDEF)-like protein